MQELIVGDTLKVLFLRRTLLRKRLFPVLYFPTIEMTPRGLVNCLRKLAVSSGTSNLPSLYLMSCKGVLILTSDILNYNIPNCHTNPTKLNSFILICLIFIDSLKMINQRLSDRC